MEGCAGLVRCDAPDLVRIHGITPWNGLIVFDAGDHPSRVWTLGGLGICCIGNRFEQRRNLHGTLPALELVGYSTKPRRACHLYIRRYAEPQPAKIGRAHV